MRKARLLLSMVIAAVALIVSKPAGVEPDSGSDDGSVSPAPIAAIASEALPAVTPEKREPAGGGTWNCERVELAGAASDLDLIARKLAVSPDPEHLLTAAILRLDDNPERGFELLAHAREANPAHPLIAMQLLDACVAHPGLRACGTHDVEAEAIRIDGTNGSLWARIAARRYREGDEAGALQALHRSATAPRYDSYWIDYVQLFERALAASTSLSYTERTFAAIGIAAALASPDLHIFKACTGTVLSSPEWRLACGDLGRRLESDARTLLEATLGLSIQARAYEAIGDKPKYATASGKREKLSAMMLKPHLAEAEMLMFDNEHLLSRYISEFDAHGEVAALRFLQDEIARFKALPGHNPCAD